MIPGYEQQVGSDEMERPKLRTEQAQSLTEVEENTEATVENTVVTQRASDQAGGISRYTAFVCGMVIAATCFIAFINKDFANQQAAIVLGSITGGVFGVAVGKRL